MNLKFLKISKYSNGFTLAEVLITLVIIGIIAAMTIPALMNNIQKRQYIVAWRKSFSDADGSSLSVPDLYTESARRLLKMTDFARASAMFLAM